jgi:hypothetical protein
MVRPISDNTESFIDPTEYYVVPDVEDLDFEKMESEMGKMLIMVTSDRRKYQHIRTETLDKEYKGSVSDHSASLRNAGQLLFLGGELLIDGFHMFVVATPKAELKNIFNFFRDTPLNFLATFFSQETAPDSVKQIATLAKSLLSSGKQVRENYLGADRSELSSKMQYVQSQLEKSGREQYSILSQEQEAVRNYEARRNKREDFMLQMARN